MRRDSWRRLLCLVVAFVPACREDSTQPSIRIPTTIVAASPIDQSATVATQVGARPAVRVTDASGNPVSGVSVSFAVATGAGSVTGVTQSTGSDGIATASSWTLGTTAGTNTLTATALGLSGSPVTFTATGTAGAPATLALNGGNGQSATAGAPVANGPSVKVTDAHGNAVGGVSVTFAVTSGGGVIDIATPTTGSDGVAGIGVWVLGTTAGTNSVTATVPGLAPVTFTATGTPGAAAVLSVNAGNNQSATVGTLVGSTPSVKVTDTHGNPVGGINVSFVVASGGGSVSGATQTTGADGIATVASWTLGLTAGSNTLTATVTGLSGSLTFSATGTAGAATTLAISTGNNQSSAVATQLSPSPSVVATDAHGNTVSGVSVTFAVASGGGGVTGATPTTGSDGTATVGGWTLGTVVGTNTLTATAAGLAGSPITFTATGAAGAAATIAPNAGNNQSATVATQLGTSPSVKVTDAHGNAVSGVSVTFAIASGGGSVIGAEPTTNGEGVATVGGWALGTTAGTNTLTASISGLAGSPVTFTATGTAGAPTNLVLNAGNNQSATVATQVGTRPSVKATDAHGNAVTGVNVTFLVTGGGGSSAGNSQATGSDGIATVGSWTLGTATGANTMTASAALSGSPIAFTATATAGDPTVFRIIAGSDQVTWVSTPTDTAPAFELLDNFGNGVPGRTIALQVTGGGGGVSQPSVQTGTDGRAALSSWTMGPAEGVNSLDATTTGFAPLSIIARAVPASSFNIDVRFVGSLSAAHQQLIQNAARRWRRVIIGDIANQPVNIGAGACVVPHSAIVETVDDLLIVMQVTAIDGAGGILGQAGVCARRAGFGFPVIGFMQLDVADLDALVAAGTAESVVAHEIGHTLGIGTDWSGRGLLTGAGGSDPFFTGPLALAAFNGSGGSGYLGNKVPVENTGGAGTRDSHWRESVMGAELMTGFLGSATRLPLSLITVASVGDLGYTVSFFGNNTYTVAANLAFIAGAEIQEGREIIRDLGYVVDEVTGAARQATPLDVARPRSQVRQTIPLNLSSPPQVLERRRY